jgi:hypothetical protein
MKVSSQLHAPAALPQGEDIREWRLVLLVLTLALDGGEYSAARSCQLYPKVKTSGSGDIALLVLTLALDGGE